MGGGAGGNEQCDTIVREEERVEVPAERALWIASSATDGRTGQEFRVLTAARMLKGMLREGVRRLTRRKAPEISFKVRTVHTDPKD